MLFGENNLIEDYVEKVMGCTPMLTSVGSSTIREYLVNDSLQMRLRYYYSTKPDEAMFIGSVEWLHLGKPAEKEQFSPMLTQEELCKHLVQRVLDYSFR